MTEPSGPAGLVGTSSAGRGGAARDSSGPDSPAAPSRRPKLTVRVRILASVLALAAFGLVVAGGTTYTLELRRTDTRIDTALARAVVEFRAVAETGQLAGDIPDVQTLLRRAVQQFSPVPHEGAVALVDGQPQLIPFSTQALRIDRDPELMAAVAAVPADARVRLADLTTARTSYRYVVVPASVQGTAGTGLYVVAIDRAGEHAELATTYRTYALLAVIALLGIGAVGWVVTGRLLRPVRDLARTAQEISETDLSGRIEVSGTDDVAELGRTVNAMLDRLERAFTSQRRLLDDVGHELRTPLTVVRGHLEVMDAADPADTAETRDLVLDEVDRMHRLVDDLMVLAAVDRPDFVSTQPTDVGRLTDDLLDKATALGERRWTVGGRADAVADLDPQRITQAWLQLAANAVKFSAPGSTVEIGSAVQTGPAVQTGAAVQTGPAMGVTDSSPTAGGALGDGTGQGDDAAHDVGAVLLWVRDEGIGIEAEDLPRVTERFARGRSPQAQAVPGSGLGLAIVAAIVAAHGGTARIDSTPGAGTTVTLVLPLVIAAAPDQRTVTSPTPAEEGPQA